MIVTLDKLLEIQEKLVEYRVWNLTFVSKEYSIRFNKRINRQKKLFHSAKKRYELQIQGYNEKGLVAIDYEGQKPKFNGGCVI